MSELVNFIDIQSEFALSGCGIGLLLAQRERNSQVVWKGWEHLKVLKEQQQKEDKALGS